MKRFLTRLFKDHLYRNSLFLIANTAITSGLGFFFWMIVARFYTEEEVGWGSAIISAITLLALLSRLGLGMALIRFLPRAEKPVELLNSCLTVSGVVAVILAAIFVAGVDIWSPALGFVNDDAAFAVAFIFFAFFLALSTLMDSVFIAKRRADFVLVKGTIFSLLKIPLPFLLVIFFKAFGIVSSWGIATALALAISIIFLLPRVQRPYRLKPQINMDIVRAVWRFSAGNYLSNVFGSAVNLILPILIVNTLGPEQNGYFYMAWMIASMLFIIPISSAQSLFAEGSHFEDQLWPNVLRSYRFIFLLLIPGVLILLLLSKWILLAFGATYSVNAVDLLRLFALSGIFVAINRVYYTILRVQHRILELVLIHGIITAAVLLGSYLATDIIGVGYTWIAIQGLVSVYVIYSIRGMQRSNQIKQSGDGII